MARMDSRVRRVSFYRANTLDVMLEKKEVRTKNNNKSAMETS